MTDLMRAGHNASCYNYRIRYTIVEDSLRVEVVYNGVGTGVINDDIVVMPELDEWSATYEIHYSLIY